MGKVMFTQPSLELSLLSTSLQFASHAPYSFLQPQFQITFWKRVKRIFKKLFWLVLVVPRACIIAHLLISSFSHIPQIGVILLDRFLSQLETILLAMLYMELY